MTDLIDWLTVQLAANPLAVAAVVAALATAEGVIVVGIFVPGATVVLAIAAAAGAAGEGRLLPPRGRTARPHRRGLCCKPMERV